MFKAFKKWFFGNLEINKVECLYLTPQEAIQFNNVFNVSQDIKDKLYKLEENEFILPLTINEFKSLLNAFNMPDHIRDKIKYIIEGIDEG